jgi:tetratricopeptide (TPR) repeat protein
MRLLAEAREAVMATRSSDPSWDPQRYWDLLGGAPWLPVSFKHEDGLRFRKRPSSAPALTELLAHGRRRFAGTFVPEEFEGFARAVRDGDVDPFNPSREELEAARLLSDAPYLVPCTLGTAAFKGVAVDFEWLASEVHHSRSLLPWLKWAAGAVEHGAERETVHASVTAIVNAHEWGSLGYVLLGDLLRAHLGRYDDAEAAYRRAIELDPQCVDGAWIGLARTLYSKGGNLEEASAAAAREVALGAFISVNGLLALMTHATILVALGDWTSAERRAKYFIESSGDAVLRDGWGEVLQFFGESLRRGFGIEARNLLAASTAAERWEPLKHALAIVEQRDATELERLAPEMREAVRLVLARISPSTLEEPTPPPVKRRRRSGRRSQPSRVQAR